MAISIEIKRAVTYSLLAHINNSRKLSNGQLDLFVPIVKKALVIMTNRSTERIMGKHISEIGKVVYENSGIEIPIPVLRNILKLISNEVNIDETCFVLNNDDSFIIKSYVFADYDVFLQTCENEIRKVQDLFKQFCKINKLEAQEDDIIKFIESNRDTLSSYLTQSNNQNNKDYTVEARFVEYFRPLPQIYEQIKEIYLGSILTSYLEYKPENLKMSVELIFDTNFIISLIDLNTPESTQTCRKLIEIGDSIGYSFHVLSDTIEEIQGLLKYKSDNFDKSIIQKYVNKEDIYNACIRRHLNKTDLQRISDAIEKTLLDDYKISVIPYTENIRNKARFSQEYSKLKPYRNTEKSALHDAICIQYVKDKRGNKRISDFAKVNCWWVNNAVSHDFDNEGITSLITSQHGNMPEIIKVDDLLNILWLSSPSIEANTIADIGLTSLIASTLNKNLPKVRILKELDDNIRKYKNEKITERDIFLLSTRIANGQINDLEKINKMAGNDSESFNQRIKEEANKQEKIEQNRAQALEKFVDAIQKEILNIRENQKDLKKTYEEKEIEIQGIVNKKEEEIKKHKAKNQQLGKENADYLEEINKLRKEKRESWLNKQIRKWRWKTWWWIIAVGILLLFILTATIWLQIRKPETNEFFKMLSDNPIVTIIVTIISVVIETPLIVNICGKYDISKIKAFEEQLMIPEDLQELK